MSGATYSVKVNSDILTYELICDGSWSLKLYRRSRKQRMTGIRERIGVLVPVKHWEFYHPVAVL